LILEASNELDFVIPNVCEDRQNTVESTASVHELSVSPKTSLNKAFHAEDDITDNVLIEAMEQWEEEKMNSVFDSFLLDDVSNIITSFILITILKLDFIFFCMLKSLLFLLVAILEIDSVSPLTSLPCLSSTYYCTCKSPN